MKSTLITLIVTAALIPASAFAEGDELGFGDTSVGEQTDVGTPDPLNALEKKEKESEAIPPPEVPAMPEFNEVGDGEKKAEEKTEENATGNIEAPTPAPEEPAPAPSAPVKRERIAEPSEPRQPDEPNSGREARFHDIYKKYNEQPTPLESWEQVSAARSSQLYKVQKRDTLWDLSKALFGDSNYWPKVWALNSDEVHNPHEIDTWMQIRFFPGDLNEPPTVAVVEAPKVTEATEAAPEGALIPPPRKSAKLLKKLPDSLPLYRYGAVNQTAPATDFQGLKAPPRVVQSAAPLSYMVSETPVKGVGTVKETELGGNTASEYQYVFIEIDDASAKTFTVVKDVGTLKNPDRSSVTAHLVEVQGEVEVIEPVSERAKLYRAIVRRNLSSIEVGSRLVPSRVQMVNILDGEPGNGPQLKVIGGQFESKRTLLDSDGFVFLNGGQSQGIQEGALLPILSNVEARNSKSLARLNPRRVGHARIVQVTDNFSTAYITKMWDDIQVGDWIGGGGGQIDEEVAPELSSAGGVDTELDGELNSAGGDTGGTDEFDLDSEPAPADKVPDVVPAPDSDLDLGGEEDELTL